MSVPASLDEGSNHEQLARAQRAHEPSMEEILASIRAIIADEREQGAPKPGPQIVYSSDAPKTVDAPKIAEAPKNAAEPEPASAAPTVVWSREPEAPPATQAETRSEAPPAPVSEVASSEVAETESAATAPVEPPAWTSEPMPAPAFTPPRAALRAASTDKRSGEAAALLSGAAERAVSQSFQTLAERMSAHGVEVATGLAREMMQPMLKAWLDENLPPIVDRLVKAEIERLTAGWR